MTCGHSNLCWKCFLKLRLVYDSNECPICREQFVEVTITGRPQVLKERRVEGLEKAKCLQGLFLDVESFENETLKYQIESFGSNKCPICVEQQKEKWQKLKDYQTWKDLSVHLQGSHREVLCHFLCFTCCEVMDQYKFAGLELFSKSDLMLHLQDMHGYCWICRWHFYSMEELNQHILKKHYACDICQYYFASEQDLKQHIKEDHFICESCQKEGAFEWWFDSWDELQEHLLSWHPGAISVVGEAEHLNEWQLQSAREDKWLNVARRDEEEARQHLKRLQGVDVNDNVLLWLMDDNHE
eukprot:TRINITY_DN5878_c0_g1_i3.p2 TRINITY_DN5878_c0_g1~~TRINITY_DN5878_c0_g1_i3.p2  ORF type:complete len:298 (-),score=48.52 TRINITY_DN5878_c0_g1_i3:405-1298(-)